MYAICRTTDDLADHPSKNTPEELCNWWHDSLTPNPACYNLVALAWGDTRARYAIPRRYAEQLLEGVAYDLRTFRYSTFSELASNEPNCYPGEPVFVPAFDQQQEDTGVILSVVLNSSRGNSFLLILDATSFSEIGRAEIPHPVLFGYHGAFFDKSNELQV